MSRSMPPRPAALLVFPHPRGEQPCRAHRASTFTDIGVALRPSPPRRAHPRSSQRQESHRAQPRHHRLLPQGGRRRPLHRRRRARHHPRRHATVQAAASAGITGVRVIETDGSELVAVRRTGLSAEQKRRLALFDNRAAGLAREWDAGESSPLPFAEETDLLPASGSTIRARGCSAPWMPSQVRSSPIPTRSLIRRRSPYTQPGDLWLLGPPPAPLRRQNTDADAVRLLMNGVRAPLMPTDPPYLVNSRAAIIPSPGTTRPR